MVLNLSFVCSLFMLWLNVKKGIFIYLSVEKSEKSFKNQLKLWLLLLFMALTLLLTCCDLTGKGIFLYFFDEKKWKWSHNRDFILLYWPVWPPWHFGWVCGEMCYPDIWIIIRILGYPDHFCYPSIQMLKKIRYPNIQISGY